ncbi:MAG: 50S ribosomal protein L30 [Bacteroidales bacterium]|jgi:large subunit ribosomal protein L30|nr:50S ribosomal protein L30 [Bacteroidales bacterium]
MKVKVTQVKSGIGHTLRQKQTLAALGLHKISQYREHELTPQIEGMIKKVSHLIRVEEIN